jgi:CBS domain-containing protein
MEGSAILGMYGECGRSVPDVTYASAVCTAKTPVEVTYLTPSAPSGAGDTPMRIEQLMIRDVIILRPDETLREATRRLAENNIGGAPVVNEKGTLVGMVNEEDIIRELRTKGTRMQMIFPSSHALGMTFEETVTYTEAREAFDEVGDQPVSSVMHDEFLRVGPKDRLAEVAPGMAEHGYNRVAVVENGKLVGIITRRDVIRGLIRTDQ